MYTPIIIGTTTLPVAVGQRGNVAFIHNISSNVQSELPVITVKSHCIAASIVHTHIRAPWQVEMIYVQF